MEQISHLHNTYFTHQNYMFRQPQRRHHRAVHNYNKEINYFYNSVMYKHMLCISLIFSLSIQSAYGRDAIS